MRILHCTPWITGGGVEAAKWSLFRQSDPARWQHAVACFSARGVWEERIRQSGVPIFSLCRTGEPERFWNPQAWRRLRKVVETFRPHLVTGSMFEGILHAHLISRRFGLPLVVEDQFDPWSGGGRFGRLSYHCAVRRAKRAVSVSQKGAEYIRKRIRAPDFKIRTIYNPARTLEPHPSPGHRRESPRLAGPGTFWIGSVSRLDERHKRIRTLLEAVGKLSAPVGLLIVGDGPDRGALEAMARACVPGKPVYFAGYQGDVDPLLRQMEIFVLGSAHEAMPLGLIEAMATGRCCVGTRIGGITEILGPRMDDSLGECGVLFPVGDSTALAEILGKLLADPESRKELGRKAAERARRLFHPQEHARALERVYEEALGA